MVSDSNRSKIKIVRTAVQFSKASKTCFAYSLDVVDRFFRNKAVFQTMFNDCDSFDAVTSAKTLGAKAKKASF